MVVVGWRIHHHLVKVEFALRQLIANRRHRVRHARVGNELHVAFGLARIEVAVEVVEQLGFRPHRRVAYPGHKKLAAVEDTKEVHQMGLRYLVHYLT